MQTARKYRQTGMMDRVLDAVQPVNKITNKIMHTDVRDCLVSFPDLSSDTYITSSMFPSV